jgi:uncharacterized protein YndB with AHSA1/START domain
MTSGPETALVVRRLMPLPRERVFAAWLDPASLSQWMCPGAVTSVAVELDPRVGGRFRIVMRKPNGEVEHRGEYLAIEPPARLSFTWISENTDFQPSVVTVEFLERGAATEVVLTHRRLPAGQVDGHRKGWTEIVGKLEATLARARHA